MRELNLQRTVELECFDVVMTLGRQENREELHSVLMLAREHGNRVSPELVCEYLLPGRPIAVGRAVLDRCRYYGLVDSNGTMTDAGTKALDEGMVFIPEEGRYRTWLANDPLNPAGLVDVEPIEEPYLDELVRRGGRNTVEHDGQEASKEGSTIDLPERVLKLEGSTYDLMNKESLKISIIRIEPKGIRNRGDIDRQYSLHLTIREDNSTSLKAKMNKSGDVIERSIESSTMDYKDTFLAMLGEDRRNWNASLRPPALLRTFEGLTSAELRTFQTNLTIRRPHTEMGDFDDVRLERVPIYPRNVSSAKKWAIQLLIDRCTEYMDEEGFERIKQEILPRFSTFDLELPSQDELAKDTRNAASKEPQLWERYWYLQAPLDLQEAV